MPLPSWHSPFFPELTHEITLIRIQVTYIHSDSSQNSTGSQFQPSPKQSTGTITPTATEKKRILEKLEKTFENQQQGQVLPILQAGKSISDGGFNRTNKYKWPDFPANHWPEGTTLEQWLSVPNSNYIARQSVPSCHQDVHSRNIFPLQHGHLQWWSLPPKPVD